MWLRDIPASRANELRDRARASGVGVYAVSPFFARPPAYTGLILGYASLTEREIKDGIRKLATAIA